MNAFFKQNPDALEEFAVSALAVLAVLAVPVLALLASF